MPSDKELMTRDEIKEYVDMLYSLITNSNFDFNKYVRTELFQIASVGEYYESSAYKSNLKLYRDDITGGEVREIDRPNILGSYNPINGRIFVYINKLIPYNNKSYFKSFLAVNLFHEYRHAIQAQVVDNSLLSIIYQIENRSMQRLFGYNRDPYSRYIENDADLFAVEQTKRLLDSNPELFNDKDLWYLNRLYEKRQRFVKTYDYDELFYTLKWQGPSDNKFLWEKVIFGDTSRFRNLDDIINDNSFSKMDSEFINKFVTSYVYYNSLDTNKLSDTSLQFLCQEFYKRREEELSIMQSFDDEYYNDLNDNDKKKMKEDISRVLSKIRYCTSKIRELENMMYYNSIKKNNR